MSQTAADKEQQLSPPDEESTDRKRLTARGVSLLWQWHLWRLDSEPKAIAAAAWSVCHEILLLVFSFGQDIRLLLRLTSLLHETFFVVWSTMRTATAPPVAINRRYAIHAKICEIEGHCQCKSLWNFLLNIKLYKSYTISYYIWFRKFTLWEKRLYFMEMAP